MYTCCTYTYIYIYISIYIYYVYLYLYLFIYLGTYMHIKHCNISNFSLIFRPEPPLRHSAGEAPRANFPSRNDPKSPSPRRLVREMGGASG